MARSVTTETAGFELLDDVVGTDPLSSLNTTDKTGLVAAVNEVDTNADAAAGDATQALADAATAIADAAAAQAAADAAQADATTGIADAATANNDLAKILTGQATILNAATSVTVAVGAPLAGKGAVVSMGEAPTAALRIWSADVDGGGDLVISIDQDNTADLLVNYVIDAR